MTPGCFERRSPRESQNDAAWRVGRTLATGNGTRHVYLSSLFPVLKCDAHYDLSRAVSVGAFGPSSPELFAPARLVFYSRSTTPAAGGSLSRHLQLVFGARRRACSVTPMSAYPRDKGCARAVHASAGRDTEQFSRLSDVLDRTLSAQSDFWSTRARKG